jgi:hypothetical protein
MAMGYGNPGNPGDGGEGAMDDLYGEGGEMPKGEKESVDEKSAMMAKTLVPLKVLQKDDQDKVEVGDERVVKVVAIHGDEAEVVYATGEGEEHPEPHPPGMPDEESGPAELDRMDQEEEKSMKNY